MNIKRTFLLLAVLGSLLPLSAQEKTDYESYMEAAGVNIPLFRGRQSLMYRTAFNGTYWWDLEGFLPGAVHYEGKEYSGVNLNLDANQQQVLLQWPGAALYIELERDLVEWFTRGDKKYLNLRKLGYASAPTGYYQVLHEGKETFLMRIDRQYTSGVNGRLSIGYDDPGYRDDVINHFLQIRNWYLIKEDGSLRKIKGKSAFLKEHKDRKRELKRYFRSLGEIDVDYSTWGTMALEYLEKD